MSDRLLDQTRERLDIEDVARDYGINFDERGQARCPFPERHNNGDANPSLNLDRERQRIRCFSQGCFDRHGHKGVDVFGFIQVMSKCDFSEALSKAARWAGLQMNPSPTNKVQGGGGGNPSETPATVQPAGCTLEQYAEAKRLPVPFLRELGVSEVPYHSAANGPAVSIPYRLQDGIDQAVKFRIAITGDTQRWRKSSKPLLYGLWRLDSEAGHVVIAEGESDAQTLWHHEINAVGLPGAASWNEERDAEHLAAYDVIYVVIEPDAGGEAVKTWLACSSIRGRVHLVQLNGFKDPSEMHVDDPDAFKDRWRDAISAAKSWREIEDEQREALQAETWARCKDLAVQSDILDLVVDSVHKAGAVGEDRSIRLLYLALTSRLSARPVSAVVKGPSSAGKSFLTEKVLSLFPETAYYTVTAMSERALAYSEEPLAHRFLVIVEAEGLAGHFGTYLIRSLLSEGRLRYETVDKTKEGLQPRLIEREGPTGLLLTTTRINLHPENETRLLSIPVTDTPAQTREVFRALARGPTAVDVGAFVAMQEWLATMDNRVSIPYAEQLAELVDPVAIRLRRDFGCVLSLIRAHALIHQVARERDDDGCVVATLQDYQQVRRLVVDLIAETIGAAVSPEVREVVQAVEALQPQKGGGCTAKDVAARLQLDKSAVSRRLKKAVTAGYVENEEDRKGKPGRWVTGEPLPEDRGILPAPEVLGGCAVAPVGAGDTIPSPPLDREEVVI